MVYIYSDVILDPLTKYLETNISESLEVNYAEDLVSKMYLLNKSSFKKNDIIIIHSDQYFHRKQVEWHEQFLDSVYNLSNEIESKILVTNTFLFSYKSTEVQKSLGLHHDIFQNHLNGIKRLINKSNIFVFDLLSVISKNGFRESYSFDLGYLYQMPYTKLLLSSFAQELSDFLTWITNEEKKVIVLDCDNTLWNGVLGEVGVDKIACNRNSEGINYYHFQIFLKQKIQEGFLLALCSKNNFQEVLNAFEKKNMPLEWDDFIVKKINWDDKWKNIQKIGKELNLGINSFIFVDDNLFELNSVKEIHKDITTYQFKDDRETLNHIVSSFAFRRKKILKSDQVKQQQYISEKKRKNEKENSQNFDEFLKNLSIVLDIRENDVEDFERLSQMTEKTNQFNFNKKPYSTDQLKEYVEKGNKVYSLKVSDKFGDYGTVGLILLTMKSNEAIMENFLLSCRALGKKIEIDFFNHVKDLMNSEGIEIADIKFKKTERNKPAETFRNKYLDEY